MTQKQLFWVLFAFGNIFLIKVIVICDTCSLPTTFVSCIDSFSNLQQIVDQAVFNLSLFSFKDCQRGRLSATVTEGWQAFYYRSRYYVLLVVE